MRRVDRTSRLVDDFESCETVLACQSTLAAAEMVDVGNMRVDEPGRLISVMTSLIHCIGPRVEESAIIGRHGKVGPQMSRLDSGRGGGED